MKSSSSTSPKTDSNEPKKGDWSKIRYFKKEDFDSPDLPGSHVFMDWHTVCLLDRLRQRVGCPLHINSAVRSTSHNRRVGGKEKSAHVPQGKPTQSSAVDIRCTDSRLRMLILRESLAIGWQRIGVGQSFIHLDRAPESEKPQQVVWVYEK